MRQDIYQVLHESARHKQSHGKPPRALLLQEGEDLGPTRMSMRQLYRGAPRDTALHLSPFRRFVSSRVGRPWAAVYSELCQALHKRDRALLDPLRFVNVETHTWVEDGAVMCRAWNGEPRAADGYCDFYVDPRTGALCRGQVPGRSLLRRAEQERRKAQKPDRVQLSDSQELHCVQGIWYQVELCALPPASSYRAALSQLNRPDASAAEINSAYRQLRDMEKFDVLLSKGVTPEDAYSLKRVYGRSVYAASKRQLSHKELKAHGLLPRGPAQEPSRKEGNS